MNRHVNYLISGVARRYRLVWLGWFLSAAWVLWALAAVVFASTGGLLKLDGFKTAYLALSAIAGTLLLGWLASRWTYRDPRWLATQIERHLPSLKERLITAVQVQETKGFFEKSLIDETIHHARSNDWSRTVPNGRVLMAWISQFLLLACAAWTILQCLGRENTLGNSSIISLLNPASQALIVEPGDVEIERGKDVVVTVRFPIEAPAEVWLTATSERNEPSRQAMVRSLKDPLFGGYVRNVQQDQEYRIEYGTNSTKQYKIKTFEYPALVRSDATIASPLYANKETRTIENTRRVTVVDGAELTWSCLVNKPLMTAELVDESGLSTPLTVSVDVPLLYQAKFVMSESKRWSVRLVDKDGRSAKFEDDLSAKVLANLPPEMKLARASDLRVSPLQEVQIQATAKDDFGIQRSGLTLVMGDSEPEEVSLVSMPAKSGKVELKHLVDLESLQAQPDQLLSYFFWAEDIDRDGNPRRVDGEMFFAEVRPFEEIFRQGESMSPEQQKQQQEQQQQSEGGKQAEELAEIQKQIVTATWNILRREKPATLSKSFLEDAKTLLESQQSAMEMTSDLEEKLKDEKSLEYLEDVRDAMTGAIQALQSSVDASDLKVLRDALQSERKAYEGLLRLRAREHNIVKSQQSQSKSASKSSSQKNRQEQLEQLKLQDEDNKYESEKQADAPEPTAQRESRQVMNRLEELARRQKDINEQLKNLETALREAKTEEKKQELEEQLKRLRDNQEELLKDSDELLERMNQPENRQAMDQAREQTEQARSDLQQSAEALSKGETSQALSSGTRAERQLDETREQMRKESSNQFEQTMRDLMRDAGKLDQQQQKLAERIPSAKDAHSASEPARGADAATPNSRDGNLPDESATPLRPEGDEKAVESLQQAIQQQKKDLNELLEKMRETVSEAESSEPLLAEQIYDSFREAKQQGLEQRLDQIPSLVDRGLEEPAARATNEVSKGIRNLKENIEQASESVIGSEQESLRRALSELKRAQRQLDEEIERKDPSGTKSSQRADGERKEGEQQPQDGQPGQPQPGQPQPGQPQDGQPQDGQPQDGQPQGGQPQGGQPQGGQPQGGQPQGGQPQGGQPQDGQPQGGQPQDGQPQDGQPQGGQPQDGQPQSGQLGGERQRSNPPANNSGRGGLDQLAEQSARQASESAPLTGENFTEWLDSLRDAEELVRSPELRAEAGRIREAARSMRIDYKRHAKEPEWPLVRRLIAEPLNQLREKVQEELLRQSAERNALIPIDRDPVPSLYQQQQDRYYENIGSGKSR